MNTASRAHVCTCGRKVVTGDIRVTRDPQNTNTFHVEVLPDPWHPACEVPASFRYTAELAAIEAGRLAIQQRRTVRNGIVYSRAPHTRDFTLDLDRTVELAQLRVRLLATKMASEAMEAQRQAFAKTRARLLGTAFGACPKVPAC